MNRVLPILALACAAFGCAAPQHISTAAVGPEPGILSKTSPETGNLVVHSAWRRTGTDDADHRIHSNYDILTDDGKPFLTVRNYVTPMLEDPATVPLAPGKYVVKARVQRYGVVEIPVLIESRKVTALYLDDSTQPAATMRETEQVQLPDGRVIGWASAAK